MEPGCANLKAKCQQPGNYACNGCKLVTVSFLTHEYVLPTDS